MIEDHVSTRPRYYILNDKHEVVPTFDTRVWGEFIESGDRIVEQTDVGSRWVSTVFLGLDHSFAGVGEPLVFETMIFPDEFCQRYASWNMAVAGHRAAIGVAEHLNQREASLGYRIKQWIKRKVGAW